ncbi:hypothetical protein [Enterococcus entomosocium]|uniref:hypothetical protein n=1 Tax=Enterococcus entomosocium TaxID=3034352 RepID=UPI0026474F46|nr:hypothetical protein [Enterococcus entomosocium]
MTDKKLLVPMNLQFFSEPPVEESQEDKPAEVVEEKEVEVVEEKPVEKEEPVEQPSTSEEVEALKKQLAEAKAAKEALENAVAAKEAEAVSTSTKVTDYEAALSKIVDQRLEAIPENIKALMPSDLPLSEKLSWIEKAEKAIPEQEPQEPEKPVIESIGQPTPVETEVAVDPKELSAPQKLQNYFAEYFGK